MRAIITTLRVRQWIKNCLVLTPVFFAGEIFNPSRLIPALWGFCALSLLSSSHYIVNDMIDRESDRKHPIKKKRPIARGTLKLRQAAIIWTILTLTGFSIAIWIGYQFFIVTVLFVVLHYLNILFFRHIALVDILLLASGHMLRLYAGQAASGVAVSSWLVISALSASLLLAIGKRRVELTIARFGMHNPGKKPSKGVIPMRYSERLLESMLAMFATAAFFSYSYFSFLTSVTHVGFFFTDTYHRPEYVARKWFMVTIPFVLYGIMRFLQLIYSERPVTLEKLLTGDKPFIATIVLWGIVAFTIVYGIGG